jgi:hypothetical protein
VLLRELFFREATDKKIVDYGRPFNHPEHLVFFYGTEGTLEALQHFQEVVGEKDGKTSVRRKWDGNPQVYWGREEAGGPLILAGHNGWARGAKSTSPEEVADFIANQSGKPGTPEQTAARQRFAQQFANLYPIFDAATPQDFVGFVYADNLFGVEPDRPKTLANNVWTFCPNPKSKTCYHVAGDSELGQRVAQAQVMVVGHAYFPTFGAPDREQQPIDDFSEFNGTQALIVQGPIYTASAPQIDTAPIAELIKYTSTHKAVIDGFLNSITPTDKNGIFYPFANQMSKAGNFDAVDNHVFLGWLEQKGVSKNKQQHIINMIQQHPGGLEAVWHLMKVIRNMKDEMDANIQSQPKADIWDTHGEGHVRYANPKKHKFGNVKFVPTSWTP